MRPWKPSDELWKEKLVKCVKVVWEAGINPWISQSKGISDMTEQVLMERLKANTVEECLKQNKKRGLEDAWHCHSSHEQFIEQKRNGTVIADLIGIGSVLTWKKKKTCLHTHANDPIGKEKLILFLESSWSAVIRQAKGVSIW